MNRIGKNAIICVLSGAAALVAGALSGGEVDFFVDMIVSDGVGRIESDYFYRAGGYPKTAKVEFEYYSWNYCRPLDSTSTGSRGLCGFWNMAKGGVSGARAHHTGEVVFWHGGSTEKNSGIAGAGKSGYGRMELDYLAKTAKWSSATTTKTATSELTLPKDSVEVPYHLCYLENSSAAYIGVYSFSVYEQLTEDAAAPALVHRYVPCCAKGVPALYDTVSRNIIYPTTDGFTLPMTNAVTVAQGKKLHVTAHTATQKSYSLAAGAELVFDGLSVLSPEEGVVLPEDGAVVVSLPESRGFGRYELVSGLPEGTEASAFVTGTLPDGFSGVLEMQGSSLYLTLSGAVPHPDALGSSLRSDAHGYIDTGYAFSPGKTSRVELKFASADYGKGTAPGPVNTANTRSVFGFWSSTVRSGARWSGTQAQIFGSGAGIWNKADTASNGDQLITVDCNTGVTKWNSLEEKFAMPTSDGSRYYIFNLYNNGAPFSALSGIFDFTSFKVWEKDGDGIETLARDFVPCIDQGKPAIYDRVTGAVACTLADTNGFVVSDIRWRVGVAGDADYRTEGEEVSIPLGGDGYVLMRRSGGGMFASGTGATATFTMPGFAVQAVATVSENVAAGGERKVGGSVFLHDFTLGAGASLEFAHDAVIYLSGDLSLPEEGTVSVSLDGIAGAGDYALIRGAGADADLSKFTLEGVPSGYAAALELHGDSLVVHVVEDPDGSPRFVSSVLSDGSGWFDTGYFYKGVGYPKTSKLSFDFVNFNYSRMPGATAGFAAQFGFWDGSKSTSMTRSYNGQLIVYYSDGASDGVSYNGNYMAFPKTGRVAIDLDYAAGTASVTHGGSTALLTGSMGMVARDATLSYYLCGCNGNNSVSYLQVNSFKVWEKPSEDGADVLAVDCVPCVAAGKVGLYDMIRGLFIPPTHPEGAVNAFKVADWGGVVTQRHDTVTTVSSAPVSVPAFAPQGTYTFTADGTVTVDIPVKSVTITYYSVEGAVAESVTTDAPAPGAVFGIALGEAVKAVVSVEDADGAEYVLDFGPVRVESAARALCRVLPKGKMDVMAAADAVLTFASETGAVEVDSYDAEGVLVGTVRVAEFVRAGVPFAVETGDAAYLVLRVAGKRRGLQINLR